MRRTVRRWLVLSSLLVTAAGGQTPEVDVSAAAGGFYPLVPSRLEDTHVVGTAAVRYSFDQRWGVQAEGTLLSRAGGRQEAGVSLLLIHRHGSVGRVHGYTLFGWDFFQRLTRRGSESAGYQLGAGLRVYLNERWFVAPEVRFGIASGRLAVGVGRTWRR